MLAHDGNFSVCIDVPDIYVAFSVATCEDTWMSWTPSGVIDIFLRTFEGVNGFLTRVRCLELDRPIHGTGKQQLCHFSVLLTLADTRVHVD